MKTAEEIIGTFYRTWRETKDLAESKMRRIGNTELAEKLRSCEMFTGSEDLYAMVKLMRQPQSIEFMTGFGFPSLDMWRQWPEIIDTSVYGLYIDAKDAEVENPAHEVIFFVGDTIAEITCAELKNYTVVALHGAKVRVKASGYSVVKIEKDNTSEIEVEGSGHAVIL